MKVSKLSVLFTIAILATSTSVISVNAAGRTSASIPNTILNGKGAPASTVGINGDFYIDTRSLLIYGPKAKSKWPLPQNLQGPTGASGTSGATGTDGKNGTDGKVSTATATTGATGATGSPGAPGAQGTPGATGATGASGSGSPGATGATGSPGSNGSPGLAGAKGETGTAGLVGETGTAGLSGISKAIYGTFAIGDISGAIGSTNTGTLTGFKAFKNYIVRINIFAYQPSDSSNYFLPMALTVASTGGSPIIVFNYSLAQGHSYRSGATRYENSFIADLVVDATTVNTDFGLIFTVTAGRSTATIELVRFTSSFIALQVDTATATF